jgi:hypothetical protein
MGEPTYFSVEELKGMRVECDALYRKLNTGGTHRDIHPVDGQLESMAMYQACVKLIEAKMWLGKVIEGMGNPFPAKLADNAPKA